jgi:hypothetical protein
MPTDPRLLRLRPITRYHLRFLGPLLMRYERCPLCARRTRRFTVPAPPRSAEAGVPDFTLATCRRCGWTGDPI